VAQYGLAVAFQVLIKQHAGTGLGHHARKRSLADLKRIAAQVIVFQLDPVRIDASLAALQ
jgi:hypothetical protein